MRARAFVADRSVIERTRAAITTMPGVTSVEHEPRTGSFLVHYDPGTVDVNTVIDEIVSNANIDLERVDRDVPNSVADNIIDAVRKLDAATAEATGGRFGVGAILSGGLAAFGVYSFVKDHKRMPRWDSLIYWAYSVFIHAHVSPTRSPS